MYMYTCTCTHAYSACNILRNERVDRDLHVCIVSDVTVLTGDSHAPLRRGAVRPVLASAAHLLRRRRVLPDSERRAGAPPRSGPLGCRLARHGQQLCQPNHLRISQRVVPG